MSTKKRKPKQTVKQQVQASGQETSVNWRKILKQILATVLGIAGLAFAIWTYCQPKISIAPAKSLDPRNVLTSPFIITNDGNIPIEDVEAYFCPKYINYIRPGGDPLTIIGDPDFNSRFGDKACQELLVGESFTLIPALTSLEAPMKQWPGTITNNAEAAVVVIFKLKYFHKTRRIIKRFIAVKNSEKELVWVPLPMKQK